MTRKERMETLGHPATRFTNIYVKNFGDANLSDEEFQQVCITSFLKIFAFDVCRIVLNKLRAKSPLPISLME